MPKVSVITACHDDGRFIEECVLSVRHQTYRDFEHIVVVTGRAEVQDYEGVKIFRISDPGGLSSTRNYGIERCEGEYVVALDADDYIHSKFLEKLVAKAAANAIVCPGMQEFGGRNYSGWPWAGYTYTDFVASNRIFVSSMFAKSAWKEVGGYDVFLDKRGCEDWCLWCDLMRIGCHVEVVSELLFYYRVHATSLMMTKGIQAEAVNYLRKKHL
jgi:glycosyltransferase involved in cell wall biosynthesis